VLILDEPIASLDPLARREFLQTLMEVTAEHELSVVMSSHLVSDLERICDYLIVLVSSRIQVAGEVETLLATHYQVTGPRCDPAQMSPDWFIVSASHTDRQSTLLVRSDTPIVEPGFTVDQIGLEDLVLAYLSQASRPAARSDRSNNETALGAKR
jgi:ABC-2 type transport system ATP-binding protein